jgi:hypothetical protein
MEFCSDEGPEFLKIDFLKSEMGIPKNEKATK